jgi:hypothetical protein
MIHRQFKREQVILGMIALGLYSRQELFQIIVGDGLSIRTTSRHFVLEVLDVHLIGVFYSRSIFLKLSFHALAYLRLRPRVIRLDENHQSQAYHYARRDLQNGIVPHFFVPRLPKTLLFVSSTLSNRISAMLVPGILPNFSDKSSRSSQG